MSVKVEVAPSIKDWNPFPITTSPISKTLKGVPDVNAAAVEKTIIRPLKLSDVELRDLFPQPKCANVGLSISTPKRSKARAKEESDGTASTSNETISSSGSSFPSPTRRKHLVTNQYEVEKTQDFLKHLPPPNTIPRRVFIQKTRSDESNVSGMSLSSSSGTSPAVDYNSPIYTASTKKIANALDFLHGNGMQKPAPSDPQSKIKAGKSASDMRRRRAKLLLSKMLRPCTAIPMSNRQVERLYFDDDDDDDDNEYPDDYDINETYYNEDEVDDENSRIAFERTNDDKVFLGSNVGDFGYSDVDEDDTSNVSSSTWGSSRSANANTVSTYDEAVLYYSDKIVDLVFDAFTTVQSTVQEGMERAKDRARERKDNRQRLRRIRSQKARLRRVRKERIRRIRRQRLQELREERQRQEDLALRRRQLAKLADRTSIDDSSSRRHMRTNHGDDEQDANRYIIPEAATDLTDVHSNCRGYEIENHYQNQRHKPTRRPPERAGSRRQSEGKPTQTQTMSRYRRY